MKKLITKTIAIAILSTLLSGIAYAETLKLSHQWSTKDVRHKVVQMVADYVANANVDLKIKIYPSKSLFKPREQYGAVNKGRLDMTIVPLAYASGFQPAYNLTLMPGLVKNHDHGARLSKSPFMAEIEKLMQSDDIITLVPGYLAGGFVGKNKCITQPNDVRGLSIRGAGKAFNQMFAAAGASITSMASSEIYSALQTGVLTAANTSSSSFISFRIYEQVQCYTAAGDTALWFMYQPLLMSKSVFDKLTSAQQQALLEGSKKAEAYYLQQAKEIDSVSIDVFRKAGVKIAELTQQDFNAWRDIAKQSSYKNFINETPNGQALLDMALSVE